MSIFLLFHTTRIQPFIYNLIKKQQDLDVIIGTKNYLESIPYDENDISYSYSYNVDNS